MTRAAAGTAAAPLQGDDKSSSSLSESDSEFDPGWAGQERSSGVA